MTLCTNPSSLEKCLLELLLNSLSSEATAIAVRIDAHKKRLMVIDNGYGISKDELPNVGEYETKNKRTKNSETREKGMTISGRNLMHIQDMSTLVMMSRKRNSSDTYVKVKVAFRDAEMPEIKKIENRPACGTTVVMYGSRKLCEWDYKIDVSAIRCIIGCLALVNRQVSFSVRDDARRSIVLRIGKNQRKIQLLSLVCDISLTSGQVSRIKILSLEKIGIEIFWGIDCTGPSTIQRVFLNLRPVHCPSLEKIVTKIVKTTRDGNQLSTERIFFLLYIRSPETEYKCSLANDQLIVEFHSTGEIVRAIEKFMMRKDSRDVESLFKVLNYRPTVPPLIFRPVGRTLEFKRKKTFFANKVVKGYFGNRGHEIKFKSEKHRWGIRKSRFPKRENIRLVGNDVGQPISTRQSTMNSNAKGDEKIVRKTRDDCPEVCDWANASNGSCGKSDTTSESMYCGEKSIKDTNQHEQTLSTRYRSGENFHSSLISRKCVETSELVLKSAMTARRENSDLKPFRSQNTNKSAVPPSKNRYYETHDISWISQKCIEKSQKKLTISQIDVEKSPNGIEENVDIGEYSTWSDWSYVAETRNAKKTSLASKNPIICQRFRFLPPLLHTLLPHGNVKLSTRDPIDNDKALSNLNFNRRRQDLEVRGCTRRACEFRLKLQSLKSMKVLNQVNCEFIVAFTHQDDKSLLVIIDQHAMHERIRYESLLRAYKRDAKNQQLISVALNRPIVITDISTRDCKLLSISCQLLTRYGVSLSLRNENTLLINAIPRCFSKKTFYCDRTILEIAVRKLLREILEDLINGRVKLLPFTIHEAVASEACRGSIKFGDPLTKEQCEVLVSYWKDTDAPNRCAHGRPSVVPLLELSSYKRSRDELYSKVKLNFDGLRRSLGKCKRPNW